MQLTKKQVTTISKVGNLLSKNDKVIFDLSNFKFKDNGDMVVSDLQTTVVFKNINIIKANILMDKKALNKVLPLFPDFITETENADLPNSKVTFLTPDRSEKMSFGSSTAEDYPRAMALTKERFVPTPTEKNPRQTTKEDKQLQYEAQDLGELDALDLVHIQEAIKFTSTDELRPAMTHVLLMDGMVVGTDAHRMYFRATKEKYDLPVMLSENLIKLIAMFEDAEDKLNMSYATEVWDEIDEAIFADKHGSNYHRVGREWAELNDKEGYLILENHSVRIIHRKCPEFYPDYQAVIPHHNDKVWRFKKSEVIPFINKALLCCNQTTHAIGFVPNIPAKQMTIISEDIDMSNEYSKTLVTQDMEQLEPRGWDDCTLFGWNGNFLLECFKVLPEDIEVTYASNNRAFIFNGYVLLMPVIYNYQPKN